MKIVIVGDGTAGWLSALRLSKFYNQSITTRDYQDLKEAMMNDLWKN